MLLVYIIISLLLYIWYTSGLYSRGYIPQSKTAIFIFCLFWLPALFWFILNFLIKLIKPKTELEKFFQDYRFKTDNLKNDPLFLADTKETILKTLKDLKELMEVAELDNCTYSEFSNYKTVREWFKGDVAEAISYDYSDPKVLQKYQNQDQQKRLQKLLNNTEYLGTCKLKRIQLSVLKNIDWD